MVFKTLQLLVRSRGPDEFWRKRKIFKLSAHFRGRARNCYSVAIKAVHRSLQCATQGRAQKKLDFRELWNTRLDAACAQHNVNDYNVRDSLQKYDVLLNRKTLTEVAAWEPRTFKALASISAERSGIHNPDSEAKHIFLTDNIDDYMRVVKK